MLVWFNQNCIDEVYAETMKWDGSVCVYCQQPIGEGAKVLYIRAKDDGHNGGYIHRKCHSIAAVIFKLNKSGNHEPSSVH